MSSEPACHWTSKWQEKRAEVLAAQETGNRGRAEQLKQQLQELGEELRKDIRPMLEAGAGRVLRLPGAGQEARDAHSSDGRLKSDCTSESIERLAVVGCWAVLDALAKEVKEVLDKAKAGERKWPTMWVPKSYEWIHGIVGSACLPTGEWQRLYNLVLEARKNGDSDRAEQLEKQRGACSEQLFEDIKELLKKAARRELGTRRPGAGLEAKVAHSNDDRLKPQSRRAPRRRSNRAKVAHSNDDRLNLKSAKETSYQECTIDVLTSLFPIGYNAVIDALAKEVDKAVQRANAEVEECEGQLMWAPKSWGWIINTIRWGFDDDRGVYKSVIGPKPDPVKEDNPLPGKLDAAMWSPIESQTSQIHRDEEGNPRELPDPASKKQYEKVEGQIWLDSVGPEVKRWYDRLPEKDRKIVEYRRGGLSWDEIMEARKSGLGWVKIIDRILMLLDSHDHHNKPLPWAEVAKRLGPSWTEANVKKRYHRALSGFIMTIDPTLASVRRTKPHRNRPSGGESPRI